MKKLLLKSLIIVLSFFALGYLREDLFVNINYMLAFKLEQKDAAYYFDNFFYKYLASLSYWFLYKLKWLLTLLFTFLYLCLTLIFNYWIFKYNSTKPLVVFIVALILLSGVSMMAGYLINDYQLAYKIARTLMGFAQSPLFFIISLPFIWQLKQVEHKEY